MAADIQSPPEPGFASLLKGIISDVGELIRHELRFARAEMKSDFQKAAVAGGLLGVGVVNAVLGVILLTFTLVHLLHWAVTPVVTDPARIPLWGCYAIVSGTFLVLGLVLAVVGAKKLASNNPLPDQTAQTVKENIEWIANSK